MNQPQVVYTVRDIAGMLGVCNTLIKKQIRAGRLRAFNKPNFNAERAQFFVTRTELVRFLLAWNLDARYMRKLLNRPSESNVVLVRTRPGLQTAVMRHDRAIRVDSLFGLGDILHKWKVWAVVVDLGEVGSAEATRSLASFSKQHDRPELVGLYDGDYHPRSETAEVFDLLLPLSRTDQEIAASIAELKQ